MTQVEGVQLIVSIGEHSLKRIILERLIYMGIRVINSQVEIFSSLSNSIEYNILIALPNLEYPIDF